MVHFRYILVNILHKGDNDDDDMTEEEVDKNAIKGIHYLPLHSHTDPNVYLFTSIFSVPIYVLEYLASKTKVTAGCNQKHWFHATKSDMFHYSTTPAYRTEDSNSHL